MHSAFCVCFLWFSLFYFLLFALSECVLHFYELSFPTHEEMAIEACWKNLIVGIFYFYFNFYYYCVVLHVLFIIFHFVVLCHLYIEKCPHLPDVNVNKLSFLSFHSPLHHLFIFCSSHLIRSLKTTHVVMRLCC